MQSLLLEFGDVLIIKFLKKLLPNRVVDQKIDLVLGLQLPSKTSYQLNQLKLKELK